MSDPSRWIRIDIGWDDSEWVFPLSPESQLAWIKLLCHVKRDGRGGVVKALAPLVAGRKFGVGEESVVKMIQAGINAGAIKSDAGQWTIVNWDKYQKQDQTVAKRVQNFREKKRKETACNGVTPVSTVSNCHATETETLTSNSPEEDKSSSTPHEGSKPVVTRFVKPTDQALADYAVQIGLPKREAQAFRDYQDSKGWKVGVVPMRDWQAALRTWLRNWEKDQAKSGPKSEPAKPRLPKASEVAAR